MRMHGRNTRIIRKAAIYFRTKIENIEAACAAKDRLNQHAFTHARWVNIIAHRDNPAAGIRTLNTWKLKGRT